MIALHRFLNRSPHRLHSYGRSCRSLEGSGGQIREFSGTGSFISSDGRSSSPPGNSCTLLLSAGNDGTGTIAGLSAGTNSRTSAQALVPSSCDGYSKVFKSPFPTFEVVLLLAAFDADRSLSNMSACKQFLSSPIVVASPDPSDPDSGVSGYKNVVSPSSDKSDKGSLVGAHNDA